MVHSSLAIHMCPICGVDNKREPLRLKYQDNTDFVKVCYRCGFMAHFVKGEVIH